MSTRKITPSSGPSSPGLARAYSYKRFSTPEQSKGDSLRRQTAMAADYCRAHGLTLDDKLNMSDLGVSAFKGKNLEATAALGAFLKAVEAGDVPAGSVLLVEALDRITRKSANRAAAIVQDIVDAGVDVVTLNDQKRYTATGLNDGMDFLFIVVQAMRAHDESANKSRRLRQSWGAKHERMRHGETGSRIVPYWLSVETVDGRRGAIKVNPVYRRVVERMFREYLAGRGMGEIATRLNAEIRRNKDGEVIAGVEPPARVGSEKRADRWRPLAVGRTLANPAVCGIYQPHRDTETGREPVGDPVPDYYPRLIADDVFAKVTALRAANQVKAGSTMRRPGHALKVVHILATLARCPVCGASMTRIAKTKGTAPRYLCSRALSETAKARAEVAKRTGREPRPACERVYVDVAAVESALIAAADTLGKRAPGPDKTLAADIAACEAALTELAPKLARVEAVVDAIGEGFEAAVPRLAKLEAERDALAGELATLRDKATAAQPNLIKQRVANMVTILKAYADGLADAPEANAALCTCFERAVLDYRAGTIALHWRHGPPPAVVKYASRFMLPTVPRDTP